MDDDFVILDPENNRQEFLERLFTVAEALPEWPSRPAQLPGRIRAWWEPQTGSKEEAVYVVLRGDRIEPIFFDNPNVRMAVMVGFNKKEYLKARAYLQGKG